MPARLSSELPAVGQKLTTLGYTSAEVGGPAPSTSDSAIHYVIVTNVLDGLGSRLGGQKHMRAGRVKYREANGEAGPSGGNSGGPVYNTRGQVVCLHNAGPTGDLQLGAGSSAVAMHDILDDIKNEGKQTDVCSVHNNDRHCR